MDITIVYCRTCNYMPMAAALAREIKETLGLAVKYEAGRSGIFDVVADGEMVFSKRAEGDRFPKKGEVVALLKARTEKGTGQ